MLLIKINYKNEAYTYFENSHYYLNFYTFQTAYFWKTSRLNKIFKVN